MFSIRKKTGSNSQTTTKNAASSQSKSLDSRLKEGKTEEAKLDSVIQLLKGKHRVDFSSLAQSYNLILEMDEDELLSNLEHLKTYANDPEYAATLSLFLDRYASIAPSRTLDFVIDNIFSERARQNGFNIVLFKKKDLHFYVDNTSILIKYLSR